MKRNTSDLELRQWKTKVGKQGVRALFYLKLPKKLNRYLENLISFLSEGYITK